MKILSRKLISTIVVISMLILSFSVVTYAASTTQSASIGSGKTSAYSGNVSGKHADCVLNNFSSSAGKACAIIQCSTGSGWKNCSNEMVSSPGETSEISSTQGSTVLFRAYIYKALLTVGTVSASATITSR